MPKAWGGCSLVLHPLLVCGTKEQPPSYAKASEAKALSLRSPPSFAGGHPLNQRFINRNEYLIDFVIIHIDDLKNKLFPFHFFTG